MKFTPLIDGDWLCYTAGFVSQRTELVYYDGDRFEQASNITELKAKLGDEFDPEHVYTKVVREPIEHTLHTVKLMLQKALDSIAEKFGSANVADPLIFVDGDGNYRNQLATIRPYKGNRVAPKPAAHADIREYLKGQWGAETVYCIETDDRIATRASLLPGPIIVGVDKDYLQVPGWHYNPNKGFKHITPQEGLWRLYVQAATGDATDNIGGCFRCGPKHATAAFPKNFRDEKELWDILHRLYEVSLEKYGEETGYQHLSPFDAALENMRLVHLLRKPVPGNIYMPEPGTLFMPPNLR